MPFNAFGDHGGDAVHTDLGGLFQQPLEAVDVLGRGHYKVDAGLTRRGVPDPLVDTNVASALAHFGQFRQRGGSFAIDQ